MQPFRFMTGMLAISAFLFACARHSTPSPLYLDEKSVASTPTDSTQEEGYNADQRALAIYIFSLPPKERAAWVSGTFTEDERNALLDSIQVKKK